MNYHILLLPIGAILWIIALIMLTIVVYTTTNIEIAILAFAVEILATSALLFRLGDSWRNG